MPGRPADHPRLPAGIPGQGTRRWLSGPRRPPGGVTAVTGPVWSVPRFGGPSPEPAWAMAQTVMPLTVLLLFRQRTGSFPAAGIAVAVFGIAFVAGGPAPRAWRTGTATGSWSARGRSARRAWSPGGSCIAGPVLDRRCHRRDDRAAADVCPAGEIVARLTAERDRAAAFSLDAVATELLFVAGPALVAAAVAFGRTADALFAAGALALAGSAFITLAAGRSARLLMPAAAPARQGGRPSALLAPRPIAAPQRPRSGSSRSPPPRGSSSSAIRPRRALVLGGAGRRQRPATHLRHRGLARPRGRAAARPAPPGRRDFAIVAGARDMAWLYGMFAAGPATAPAAQPDNQLQHGRHHLRPGRYSHGSHPQAASAAPPVIPQPASANAHHHHHHPPVGAALPIAAATAVPQRTWRPGKPHERDSAMQPTAPATPDEAEAESAGTGTTTSRPITGDQKLHAGRRAAPDGVAHPALAWLGRMRSPHSRPCCQAPVVGLDEACRPRGFVAGDDYSFTRRAIRLSNM